MLAFICFLQVTPRARVIVIHLLSCWSPSPVLGHVLTAGRPNQKREVNVKIRAFKLNSRGRYTTGWSADRELTARVGDGSSAALQGLNIVFPIHTDAPASCPNRDDRLCNSKQEG